MSSLFGSSQQQPATPNSTGNLSGQLRSLFGTTSSTITPSHDTFDQPSATSSQPRGFLFGTGSGGSLFSTPSVPNSTDAPSTTLAPFLPLVEKETNNPAQKNSYQSILFQDCYKRWSADELRLTDYNQGRRFGMTTGSTSTGNGLGGSTSGGLFGGGGLGSSTDIGGATSASASSSSTAPRTTGLFGSMPPRGQTQARGTGLFDTSPSTPAPTGLFGAVPQTGPTPATTSGCFGSDSTTSPSGLFGSVSPAGQTRAPAPGTSLFGTSATIPGSGSPSVGQTSQAGKTLTSGSGPNFLLRTRVTPEHTSPSTNATTTAAVTGENIGTPSQPAASGLPLHPPKPRVKKDDVEWLSERYFGTTPVAVRCGSDDKTYVFPKEVLTQNFEFFRNELQSNEDAADDDNDAPKGAPRVHLPDITAAAFARLVRWTQADESDREDAANPPDGDHTIDELLDEIVAASYLGLDSIDELETHICCLISTILLKDRRKLTAEHIKRTETHDAFKHVTNGGGVARVFRKAGVRPLFQMTMLASSMTPFMAAFVKPGHAQLGEWLAIVRHCRQLREDNAAYATSVMREVTEHLAKCGRGFDGRPVFLDPLDDDEMKGRRSLGFATEFTM
ncbi:hypothetical protein GE09DRAFT_1279172 [Coniochaeta sp. 2T2.1]|nr:hypothetical protein GE09DRAFT_1279172 [Coniochaeta sp. 2T2.1]